MSAGLASQDLLAKLNKEQATAVSLEWGPALIIAGAGSGKTTVLTRRIAWLISQLNQDPESILAVTFTNKAAKEMKSRVESLVGQDVGRRLSIGTFHSICARILRREIDQYETPEGHKWTGNFVIYDESDSMNLVKACVTRLNLDEKVFIPKSIKHEISSLKNDGMTCAQYATVAKTYREQRISELFTAYQADLARNNAFDFDDLINVFTDLLKQNPAVLARQRRRFKHVMVDEFQDTNKSQYDLVTLLSTPYEEGPWNERSLMVVGDVDQSIYSWRKADFRIILGFQKDYKDCQLVKLEENYRSTETILEIANSIIINNTERLEKVLRCNRGKGGKAQCFEAQDEIDESFYVVEELKRLKDRGRTLNDACILYRTNAQSRAIEEILVRNHIPYTMVGATKFYDRQEIKDVLAYLKLIYNGKDSISFNRVINVPRRGIGKTSLERLASYAASNRISMLAAAAMADRVPDLPTKAAAALREFALLMRGWQSAAGTLQMNEGIDAVENDEPIFQGALFAYGAELAKNKAEEEKLLQFEPETATDSEEEPAPKASISVCALLQRVLKETRYLDKLSEDEKDEQAESRIEHVTELVAVAQEFDETADEPDLDSFLTRISLVSDLDSVKLDQDAVKLMTVHSAKGLEFAVVFVMGLEEGLFPHIRSLDSPTAMEEERRLMYVAVTRAADLLYLTLARKRMIRSQGNFTTTFTIPSQFLREISPGLLAGYYPAPKGESKKAGYDDHIEDSFSTPDDDNRSRRDNRTSTYDGGGSKYGGGGGGGYGGSGNYGGNNQYGNRSGNSGYGGSTQGGNRGGGNGYGGGNSGYGGGARSSSGGAKSGPSGYGGTPRSGGGSYGGGGSPGGRSNPPPARPRAMRPGEGGNTYTSSNENIRVQIDGKPPSAPANFEHFVVGDVVTHAKFGTGKVVQVIGDQDKEIYNVEFEEAGKRLLDPKFAKLVKMP